MYPYAYQDPYSENRTGVDFAFQKTSLEALAWLDQAAVDHAAGTGHDPLGRG